MEHEGKPLAADETGPRTGRSQGVASVHVRAIATWVAIFPLVALGTGILSVVGNGWPVVVRALVLTAVVVPLSVYLVVPRLLLAYSHAHFSLSTRRTIRTSRKK